MTDNHAGQAAPTHGGGFAASSHPGRSTQTFRDIETDDRDAKLLGWPRLDVSTFTDSAWPDVATFRAADADQEVTVTIGREDAAALVHQLVAWLAAGQ
ncbi:hypothetical protein A5784_14040 [Mycobacterium sp. 852013-50091_SCH5140682]|uniref:hypothetical protein n=1 Tax=Mycobacterium sp. 852013-50091_SCH5140682 TaxID=1834109 RepID=UPI0007EAB67F|nr:hypothetical protein [Mycobacterium sp. 852013-50091_SCH5140682]OBC03355.1 hypothetical protein A5784_14040 [Mycobacterium sp. 852013-50091_SCH5140682]